MAFSSKKAPSKWQFRYFRAWACIRGHLQDAWKKSQSFVCIGYATRPMLILCDSQLRVWLSRRKMSHHRASFVSFHGRRTSKADYNFKMGEEHVKSGVDIHHSYRKRPMLILGDFQLRIGFLKRKGAVKEAISVESRIA